MADFEAIEAVETEAQFWNGALLLYLSRKELSSHADSYGQS
jgi:hypothetical protein